MKTIKYGKLLYMLGQLRTTACSGNKHIAGRKGGVVGYVRMNINYDQTVAKESGLQKPTLALGWVQFQLMGQRAVTLWNSLSSHLGQGFSFKGYSTGCHSNILSSSL